MAKNDDREFRGNARGSAAAYAKRIEKAYIVLDSADHTIDGVAERGLRIVGIKLRVPRDEFDEWFGVVTAEGEGGRVVAFHSADSMISVLVGVLNRLRNGSMGWREDQYE